MAEICRCKDKVLDKAVRDAENGNSNFSMGEYKAWKVFCDLPEALVNDLEIEEEGEV